jgi:flagellar biosynthesis/type III secretory pathway protein FliH
MALDFTFDAAMREIRDEFGYDWAERLNDLISKEINDAESEGYERGREDASDDYYDTYDNDWQDGYDAGYAAASLEGQA